MEKDTILTARNSGTKVMQLPSLRSEWTPGKPLY